MSRPDDVPVWADSFARLHPMERAAVVALAASPGAISCADLAQRLDLSEKRLLWILQGAFSAGVPIVDDGEGTLDLPASARDVLRVPLLPTLAASLGDARPAPGAAPLQAPADPPSEPAPDRIEKVRGLVQAAITGWLRAHNNGDGKLHDALGAAGEAIDLLRDDDDAELRTSAVIVLAGICHDIGDLSSLDRALDERGHAVRQLTENDSPVVAARLLNDEAAIWLRIGDPVRAHTLLQRSRGLFTDKAQDDPAAKRELAETDHHLARLPLHVAARPGRENDAIDTAIEAAMRAERGFAALDDAVQTGRVMTTRGRLLLAAGRLDEGASVLLEALERQQVEGDEVAMANTSAALAEALALAGRIDDGLRWLARSAQLNAHKGSHHGLASNHAILARLAPMARTDVGRSAAMVAQSLIEQGLGAREAGPPNQPW